MLFRSQNLEGNRVWRLEVSVAGAWPRGRLHLREGERKQQKKGSSRDSLLCSLLIFVRLFSRVLRTLCVSRFSRLCFCAFSEFIFLILFSPFSVLIFVRVFSSRLVGPLVGRSAVGLWIGQLSVCGSISRSILLQRLRSSPLSLPGSA